MLSCKDTSLLLSKSCNQDLAWQERLAVRFHLLFCRGCTQFAKQLQFLRAAAQRLAQSELLLAQATLSEPARRRIRAALRGD